MTKTFVREVNALSNDIASYILGKNIGSRDVISILIPRSEFMPVTAIGALKTGCEYQPLDPTNVKKIGAPHLGGDELLLRGKRRHALFHDDAGWQAIARF